MSEHKTKKTNLGRRLRNRYLLVIRREETYEERFRYILTPLNLVLLFSSCLVVFGFIVILLFGLTPLKSYIPTYGDGFTPKEKIILHRQLDSLNNELNVMNQKAALLSQILKGDSSAIVESGELQHSHESVSNGAHSHMAEPLNPPAELNTQVHHSEIGNFVFFKPLDGLLTDTFDMGRKHYAIDIVSKQNDVVKSTMDGVVVFSDWTPEDGHILIVQHANNLVSVYKHNSVLLKKTGNFVNAGDAIALVGNSGEQTSGPHLHFELWYNGTALDPQLFIDF